MSQQLSIVRDISQPFQRTMVNAFLFWWLMELITSQYSVKSRLRQMRLRSHQIDYSLHEFLVFWTDYNWPWLTNVWSPVLRFCVRFHCSTKLFSLKNKERHYVNTIKWFRCTSSLFLMTEKMWCWSIRPEHQQDMLRNFDYFNLSKSFHLVERNVRIYFNWLGNSRISLKKLQLESDTYFLLWRNPVQKNSKHFVQAIKSNVNWEINSVF